VSACGVRHEITVRVDPIRQVPRITHDQSPSDVKTGTTVTVRWPDSAWPALRAARWRFLQLAGDFAWLNPHLKLTAGWRGSDPASDHDLTAEPTRTDWAKWKPSDPTSAHWYTRQRMERLVAAYVSDEAHAGTSVREFVTQFRGLTGTGKGRDVLAQTGMARTVLADLANGQLDSAAIGALLQAMQENSRPVKPAQLGIIGRDHLAARMTGAGAEMDSFAYKKIEGEDDGQPYVVETAFAWVPDLGPGRLITGVNWSPGLVSPFRQLGRFGQSLDTVLQRQRADRDCIVVVHVARPVVSYADRGKSSVVL
jgi:hypothetical protein